MMAMTKMISNIGDSGEKTNDMFRRVLFEPARYNDGLRILSGYTSSSMAKRHMDDLEKEYGSINIDLIYGMTPSDGVPWVDHMGFKELTKDKKGFTCSYIMVNRMPCHAKLYIWTRNGIPTKAFMGSANYSQNSFYNVTKSELMIECDPKEANAFYERFSGETVYCDHDEVVDMVNIGSKRQVQNIIDDSCTGLETFLVKDRLRLSLLSSKGEMLDRGSLNWGQREKRDRNQAYIPIQRPIGERIVKEGFFPPKGTVFTAITDDGFTMYFKAAGNDSEDPVAKQLETSNDNSVLGSYFRMRIGAESGEYITKEMLERYGRTNVDFVNLGDGTYYMDFSVKPKK